MDFLSSLFVQKPLHILVVALVFLAGFLVLRFTALGAGRHATALLVPVVAWLLYAAWEWFVTVKSPEANIRVDLLVLWPLLAFLSIWFVIKALRQESRPLSTGWSAAPPCVGTTEYQIIWQARAR